MADLIEFEQKYLFNPKQAQQVLGVLQKYNASSSLVRQFYELSEGQWLRYRYQGGKAVKEIKTRIPFNTPYSISTEVSAECYDSVFEEGFAKSQNRLQKLRYQLNKRTRETALDHSIVFDFFLTQTQLPTYKYPNDFYVYAIICEVEYLLTPQRTDIDLNFRIPLDFSSLLVKRLDSNDPLSKKFGSRELIDKPKVVRAAVEHFR